MVSLIGVSTSKGYSQILKFYSQLREKWRNQKHVENRQGFPIDRIQKNIIISIQIISLKTYSHPLVYSVKIVVAYFDFSKQKFNNDFRGATKHDYFLVLSFYKDTLSNICQKYISQLKLSKLIISFMGESMKMGVYFGVSYEGINLIFSCFSTLGE